VRPRFQFPGDSNDEDSPNFDIDELREELETYKADENLAGKQRETPNEFLKTKAREKADSIHGLGEETLNLDMM